METAVMIDGAFLRKRFRGVFKRYITAKDIQDIVAQMFLIAPLDINKDHRVYFYDCSPCAEMTSLPVSHKLYNFETTNQFKRGIALLDDIRRLPFFAVREGQLSFCGWKLRKRCYDQTTPHTDDSFEPELHQKGVDIKIGLDMAWVSYNNVARHIILVTADSDFVPAIKTARRSGVFVHLFTLGLKAKRELIINADVCDTRGIKEVLPQD